MAEQTENPRVQSAGGVASGAACMVSRADRILAPNVPTSVIVVGARIARPRREAAFHERCDSCEKPVHTTAPQRPPCAKGPQGSAACGRTSDRSDWAAACLDGPQRGPSRLSGNPELSAARLTGGLLPPPSVLRPATSPKALRALGEAWAATFGDSALAPQPGRRAMRAPTTEARPGTFDGGAQASQQNDVRISPYAGSACQWPT